MPFPATKVYCEVFEVLPQGFQGRSWPSFWMVLSAGMTTPLGSASSFSVLVASDILEDGGVAGHWLLL